MNTASQSDRDLVIGAIDGDTDAFGELYQRYIKLIYKYIYYRVGDQVEAEDLTETVFLKVWETLPRFDYERTSFKTWLYRIAHNLVVDRFRTKKTVVPLDSQLFLEDHTPLPEDEVIRRERSEWIAAAISKLPPDYQQILILRFIERLNHSEAAEIMERSVSAVRVLQYRALKALAKLMHK